MAWMAMTAGLWHEPVTARWCGITGEVSVTVVGCGSLRLTPDETKTLIHELDSALVESEAAELDESVEEAASVQRARLMLIVNQVQGRAG
jgi:hypothetical protein